MRITEISLHSVPLPVVNGPYAMSHGPISSLDSTLVRITTDDGTVGWGETCPLGPVYQPHHTAGAVAALSVLAPGLIGADPTRILSLHRRMDGLLSGHGYAKAPIDIAAHDLTGKHFGVRVADLLGGAVTERVPSYFALSPASPDATAERAAERVAEGYPRLQLKIGGRPIEVDIEAIRRVHERVGDRVRLAVDANRGLTGSDAIRLSSACADVPIVLEQLCNTIEEIERIRPVLRHPVFLDETTSDLAAVLRAVRGDVADGFGMKVTRVGGIRPMSVVRDLCDITSLPHTVDDAWGGDVIAAACVHVGATVRPQLLEGVWIAAPYIDGHLDPEHPIDVVDGHIALPSGPGLGVVPHADRVGPPIATFA